MADDKSKTYTFYIKDVADTSRVVNLVVNEMIESGEYASFLVDYDLTPSDKANIELGDLDALDIEEVITWTPFEGIEFPITSNVIGNGAPCYEWVSHIGVSECSGGGHHISPDDPNCGPKDGFTFIYSTPQEVPCNDVGPAVPVYVGGGGGGSSVGLQKHFP